MGVMVKQGPVKQGPSCAMAVVSTNLLAHQARLLAEMIETLPVSLVPGHQHARCLELVDQLAAALEELPAASLL
jgi:hypothetical protein